MPNCDFFAIGSDLEDVLNYVFTSGSFAVYESYSKPGTELRTFSSISQVAAAYPLGECTGTAPSVLLQLCANGTGTVAAARVALDPKRCNGETFRFRASGWGLIQLYLGGTGPKGIVPSHTNHFSETRALKLEPSHPELAPVSAWNWRGVEAASSQLNRFLRKRATTKVGSRPVLPNAAKSYPWRNDA
jgi:hypothetical protein